MGRGLSLLQRAQNPLTPCLPVQAALRFHYKNRSESKTPKTPPSHDLTGLAAIEVIAKNAGLRRADGGRETGGRAVVMQGAPGEMLPCKRPVKPGCGRRSCLTPLKAGRQAQHAKQARPGCARFRSFFGSKFKALKTPPSHGLTGFVAIKVVAKWVVEMGGFREG